MIAAQTRSQAEQLRAEAVAQPDNFEALAKDKSEDENSAAARGLIPPVRRHVGDPNIEQLVFSLKPGEISRVLEAAGQFLIFKCERHLPPRELNEADKQHVLAQLKERVADQKLRLAASELFKQLQGQARIVNVYNDPQRRKEMPGVAALINDQRITLSELGEQCILRHGADVLEGEINRVLLMQALKRRSARVTEEDIQLEVRRAAEAYGFVSEDGTADVDRWLKKVTEESEITVDVYVRDAVWPTAALKRLVGGQMTIEEEDLKKGFLANYGPRVEVLAIVLSNQRTAHKVFDLARQRPTDEFFGELAHQYSIEPMSRANFGKVPPIRMYGGQPLIEKEAFRLKPGEISSVLAMGDKYIVLRCLGRTKPVVEDISLVREELENDIREKKLRLVMTREFDRLRQSAQIDNFLAGTTQAGKKSQTVRASYQQGPAAAGGSPATANRQR
jgi:parvulin-like peptidyl-prolyl isomerase